MIPRNKNTTAIIATIHGAVNRDWMRRIGRLLGEMKAVEETECLLEPKRNSFSADKQITRHPYSKNNGNYYYVLDINNNNKH